MDVSDPGSVRAALPAIDGPLDALLAEDRLSEVALYAGSEAARGIPRFRMKRPAFATTSADELAAVIDGSYLDEGRKPSPALAYGQAKYIAALWMASMARRHPGLRFVTMSPGNTSGTGTLRDQPLPLRLAARYVMPVLGLSHGVQAGLFPDLGNPAFQDNARAAIHRFIRA